MSGILLIDEHPIVLQGMRQMLGDVGANQIIDAQTLANGFRLYRAQKPDIIVMDLSMRTNPLGGLSFIRRLRSQDRHTPILVLTMISDPAIVSRAIEVGATGYVLKDAASDEVVEAFQRVREHRNYLSHELATEVAFMAARGMTNSPLQRMSVRELQTLVLVAEEKPYRAIADHLHVSYKTVCNTCRALKTKLNVSTLGELKRAAIQYLPSATVRPAKQVVLPAEVLATAQLLHRS